MVSRHTLIYVLFLVVVGTIAILGPRQSHSDAMLPVESIVNDVPADALAALRDGRFLRASLILREYLASRPDSTPAAVLLAARAESGWGDWERVTELLEGRVWLDGVAAGYGWSLLGRGQLELGRWREAATSLERYLAISPEAASEHALARLKLAQSRTEQRDFTGALEAYDAAAALLPQIGDWVQAFAASAAAGAGDTAEVRERLTRIDSVLAGEWSWRTMARARRNAGDVGGALAEAEQAARRVRTETRRASAWTLVGQLRQEQRNIAGARAAYIRALNAAQGSSAAIEAARALSALGNLSAADQLLVGRVYLRHGNTQRGVAGLSAYIEAGLGTAAERERLRYDLANALFRGGEYAQAERALHAVASAATDRKVASDALYTAARALYRDGRPDPARATLERIVRDYADQPAAARAAYLTADLDHDAANLERATEGYRQAIRFRPTSAEAAAARMRLGGIAFADRDYEAALREFEEYRRTHRSGSAYQQATFWTARTLAALGRRTEARARLLETRRLDPFSYYGGLAADELGDDGWAARLEAEPPPSEQFVPLVQRALARVDLLRQIGWDEAAVFEMDRVRRHFASYDGALYTLAEELNARGFTSAGVSLGWEIYRREGAWNLRLLRIIYPFPFRSIVMAEARERGVDPFLAAALIRQESMFSPTAQSPAGAMGLMQVMPATGNALARGLGVNRFKPDMLFRPDVNVAFGMAYLDDQLRAYGNRLDAVLAAYNAGPGRVTRWRQFPEYHDRLLFAERIPFDETRDYVRIVQNNRRMYAALYGELVPLPSDR